MAHFDGRKLATRTTFQNVRAWANQFIKAHAGKSETKKKTKKQTHEKLRACSKSATKGPRPSEARFFCSVCCCESFYGAYEQPTTVWLTCDPHRAKGSEQESCEKSVKQKKVTRFVWELAITFKRFCPTRWRSQTSHLAASANRDAKLTAPKKKKKIEVKRRSGKLFGLARSQTDLRL